MSESPTRAAAAPTDAATDPLLTALLNFEPVPRLNKRKDGWTEPLQRQFIALLASTGSPSLAAEAMGKNRFGIEKLYKAPGAASFRAAWDGAVALFAERSATGAAQRIAATAQHRPPAIDRRRRDPFGGRTGPGAASEPGEPAPEEYEQARENIRRKLLGAKRLLLLEIRDDPLRRAAWEVLCGPVDWDAAETIGKQPDEDTNRANMRQPDMSGNGREWLAGRPHRRRGQEGGASPRADEL
jgi:hypothetical protein